MKKIAFLWNGINRFGNQCKDGLWRAMKRLENDYDIIYLEPDDKKIYEFNPDVVLFWGPLCDNKYKPEVAKLPFKKAILFGGGPITYDNVSGFDLYFVESEVNEKELEYFGCPYIRAFGINEDTFKPMGLEKKYDGAFWGTFCNWKRHDLFSQALGEKGIAIGRKGDSREDRCRDICVERHVEVHDEMDVDELSKYINMSHTSVNTASVWGGGQRMTLESMACNVPPIVMKDSPKNIEYVEESGVGLVVEPEENAIRDAIEKLRGTKGGFEYVMSKYTSKHYADNLKRGIESLLCEKV